MAQRIVVIDASGATMRSLKRNRIKNCKVPDNKRRNIPQVRNAIDAENPISSKSGQLLSPGP